MKTIQLTKGQTTLVDDEDFEYLNQFRWSAYRARDNDSFYALRSYRDDQGKRINVSMHRVIMDAPKGMDVDHKDRDGLNNQRANLRVCTRSQNQLNTFGKGNSRSAYKCVDWHKRNKKWRVRVLKEGTRKEIGYFETELEAGIIANITIRRYHGEFARTTPHI